MLAIINIVRDIKLLQSGLLFFHLLDSHALLVLVFEAVAFLGQPLIHLDIFCLRDKHTLLFHQEIDLRQKDELLS